MSHRDRVEDIMVNRFLLDKELPLTDSTFSYIINRIDPIMLNIANTRKILGFTNEDLYSLMYMQVHQTLRRGMYDPRENPCSFFSAVFNNMFNDMNRRKEVALKEFDPDPLDLYLPYNELKDSYREFKDEEIAE